MSRLVFDWRLVPGDVLAELSAVRSTDPGPRSPEQDLETVISMFGDRPSVLLVRVAWNVLRTGWLARDDAARADICADLRRANLGDSTLPLDDALAQLEFLNTCPTVARLREIVLDRFLMLGETGEETVHDLTTEWSFDLDWAIESAWVSCGRDLARQIEALDGVVVLHLPSPSRTALRAASPQLRVVSADEGIVVELAGSADAYQPHALMPAAIVELEARGFDVIDDVACRSYPDDPPTVIADAVVDVLRSVFDVPHPSFLDLPRPISGDDTYEEPGLDLVDSSIAVIGDPAALEECFEEWLTALLGERPRFDDRGHVAFRSGSSMVFVRFDAESMAVEFHSPLLSGVASTYETLSVLNQRNASLTYTKLFWDAGHVVASSRLQADPFVPALMTSALELTCNLADLLDDDLRTILGGRRFFDDPTAE